ncbi:hypothetical protein A3D80_00505 [Candidatus Roizmanbacteria bacterium RIFCSPHIGHO2_02_FULL_40_13b]|uniref:Glycosyltransferase 2-like domain-containing protein n=1 Tax=Candidatus Roizmanbacteria bacterium RIFCSPHIGHO2_01_FULL_39_24 TaxID=1802032 RepID=A0A1F7GKC5_9BACT|nr:MAG: hypothetical protein A2799_02470 [Candidatus Roizmanbacteria bacterium RIFCSPHIGHO2_01_FULL_39_24]OGK27428.1 MAG: hypothetical protein A3D80_00505 [Candidatus Roizmanbacteria bacterium RIFCSPHIGHO2_02_FULL_40_13b]OGK50427.1 MAG: hypothetical protein A3A56_02245 [Candidatus Roizmanbacteria bacterium RIFCSPLOWO2_01_FULL_40_32]OGK56976.1 MAG: hypothetical protein A3H83_00365 [Candidatus Roizmanbacteria bacterium RIFCSPLOWO2_02_FULL_39_8]
MKPPFFTIIIPTLNEEKMLPKLLGDIEKQEERDFELIVVDGNSEDKTPQIVRSFEDKIPLKLISVKKRSVSYQRNIGAQQATGEYLVFFDADIRILPSFLTRLKKNLLIYKYLLCLPQYFSIERFFQDKAFFNMLNWVVDASQITNLPLSLGFGMIFERNFFNHLEGFNEKLFMAEDHEIVRRAKEMGVQTKIVKQVSMRVSIRRFKREGRLTLLRKYSLATVQSLRTGGVEKKIFDYKMGGDYYNQSKPKSFEDEMIGHFQNIKKRLNKLT